MAIWQKSAYHAKYLRIFWTYLDLLYRFVGELVGMIFQIFVSQRPKGRCYGNQLNVGDVRKRRVGPPFVFLRHSTTDWPIVNRLSKYLAAIIGLHISKFGEFTSSNLGGYAVKWAIFAAMHPQFDDDLHSSPCHFQTDWKIAILISAE